MRLLGEFQASLVFYEKILRVKKQQNAKLSSCKKFLCARKLVAFVVFCLLVFISLVHFGLIYVFVRLKSFRKKMLA